MLKILNEVDNFRLHAAPVAQNHKSAYGQFMTPAPVARFMAGLFSDQSIKNCNLLDAGAGMGALSAAFLERWANRPTGGFNFEQVHLTAFEIDPTMRDQLARTCASFAASLPLNYQIEAQDFIRKATLMCWEQQNAQFSHAILNPPYKKINSESEHRRLLRKTGIETVNLYTAFVALAVELMAPDGEIVAIIPRSFCNGPYYKPFREFVLRRAAIRQIHLFKSRNSAFKDDAVLQENVIIHLQRGAAQQDIKISTSTDESFADFHEQVHPLNRVIPNEDAELFIHIPQSTAFTSLEQMPNIRYTLSEIGLNVSTGPVVDFRVSEYLHQNPVPGTVPLLYPLHFNSLGIDWPKLDSKKPNAIVLTDETTKWLYPIGNYCVVRRFSSKEEKRRIVARLVDGNAFPESKMLGFENHINLYHENKRGLPLALAAGMATYLNTTAVDQQFRRFNGHTQVNVADLKSLKYPSREALTALGLWAIEASNYTQDVIDHQFGIMNDTSASKAG